MALTLNQQHEAEAQARLLTQFRLSPKLIALLNSYINEIQNAENAAWATYRSRFIDEATGTQLDLLGALVGQPRNGQADIVYRAYIKLRIFINKSSGTGNALLYTVHTVMADAQNISIEDEPPASFVISAMNVDPALVTTLVDLLGSVRAAGVGGQLVYSDADSTGIFQLSSDEVLRADGDRGLSDEFGSAGGKMTGVVVI